MIQLERKPSPTDLQYKYTFAQFEKRYGGWRKFLLAIGEHDKKWSDEDLMNNYEIISKNLGRPANATDMYKWRENGGFLPHCSYVYRYGKWSNFIRHIGLEPSAHCSRRFIGKDTIYKKFIEVMNKNGHIPTLSDIACEDPGILRAFNRYFKTYGKFLKHYKINPILTKNCEYCGKKFSIDVGAFKCNTANTRRFCNNICTRKQYRIRNPILIKQRLHKWYWNHRNPLNIRNCLNCGVEYQTRNTGKKYCNIACMYKYRSERLKRERKDPILQAIERQKQNKYSRDWRAKKKSDPEYLKKERDRGNANRRKRMIDPVYRQRSNAIHRAWYARSKAK